MYTLPAASVATPVGMPMAVVVAGPGSGPSWMAPYWEEQTPSPAKALMVPSGETCRIWQSFMSAM